MKPTGETEMYGEYGTRLSNRALIVHKDDETATTTLRVSAGVKLTVAGEEQTPAV
jgi:hypothetical protein